MLIFLGNGNGVIGYGKGKGINYSSAYMKAIANAKANLILINWEPLFTCPRPLKARFNDVRLKIFPRTSFRPWGNPLVWMMLLYSGLHHCAFSMASRKFSPYALVYAFFICATQNSTPRMLCERSGSKIYTVSITQSAAHQPPGLL